MADTEKITVNMNVVDLGRIDLLVGEGFYSGRSDFVRTAVRQQLLQHADQVKSFIVSRHLGLGVGLVTKGELEEALARGGKVTIQQVGMLIISDDVTPELALKAIASVTVYGVVRATPAVKVALGLK